VLNLEVDQRLELLEGDCKYMNLSVVLLLAVDEADGRVTDQGSSCSHPVTSDTAAAGDASHASSLPRDDESSATDNKILTWASADVMSWLERSRLQHLKQWLAC